MQRSTASASAGELSALWRQIEGSSEREPLTLGKLRLLSTGLSIDSGELLVGIDAAGQRHFMIPMPPGTEPRVDRRSRGVHIEVRPFGYGSEQRPFVDVACRMSGLQDIYTSLVAEMLESVLADERRPLDACLAVLERWRRLLAQEAPGALSVHELGSLFAELLFLEDVVRINPAAISAWEGPHGGRHDFVGLTADLEVKSSLRQQGRRIVVTDLQQLEVATDIDLAIGFAKLRPTPGRGRTVPSIVRDLCALNIDSADLYRRLSNLHYVAADEERYGNNGFEVVERCTFAVDPSFPRLTASHLRDEVLPEGVVRISYECDLTHLHPLKPGDQEALLQDIARASYR